MLFTYIDGMSALSVRGYAEEQAARAGERDRRRAELARLLVTGVDEDALRELAVLARWPLPEQAGGRDLAGGGEARGPSRRVPDVAA